MKQEEKRPLSKKEIAWKKKIKKLWLILAGEVIALALLMVGFVVHVSGVIGFVGLIIPHTVRGIFGVDHKKLLPLSALTGSVFLVWADVAARTILPRTEVPIGILISVVGAPFFIFLMVRKNYSFGGRA